jgi:hypothetical protein
MKISKALLGAILAGIAIQATVSSCTKKEDPQPQTEEYSPRPASGSDVDNSCPGCGMG